MQNRDFMSFVDGTSRSSAPTDDDEAGLDHLNTCLDRWGDRRVPKRNEDRGERLYNGPFGGLYGGVKPYRGEQFEDHRPGYPYS